MLHKIRSNFHGLFAVKASFEAMAVAALAVGGRGLFRSWWPEPVLEIVGEACLTVGSLSF